MSKVGKKIASILIVAMFLLVSVLAMLPTASALNDPPNNHMLNHWSGNWVVEDAKTYDGMTQIVMDNGIVTVKHGGVLTLDNAELMFDCAVYGQRGIVVESGGQLIMKNNAFIGPWSPRAFYMGFMDGSTVTLDGSTIFGPGGNVPGANPSWTYGIFIESKNVTMDKMLLGKGGNNNDFLNIMNGGHLIMRNSTLNADVNTGLSVYDGQAEVYDSTIKTGGGGFRAINVETKGQASLVKDDIGGFGWIAVYNNHGQLDIKESRIHDNGGMGVFVSYSGKATLTDNTFDKNNIGLYISDNGEAVLDGKNVFSLNSNRAIQIEMFSKVTSTGTEFSATSGNNVQVSMHSEFIAEKNTFTAPMFGSNIVAMDGSRVVLKSSDLTGGGGGMGNAQVYGQNNCRIELYKNSMTNSGDQISGSWNTTIIAEDNVFSDSSAGFNLYALGDLTSRRNSYKNVFTLFYNFYESNILSEDEIVNSPDGSRIAYTQESSVVEIRRMTATMGDFAVIGTAWMDSQIRVYDSTFKLATSPTSPVMFADGPNAYFLSINSTPNKLEQTDAINGGIVEIGYHAGILTQWQNGAPAPEAQVTVKDRNGKTTHAFNSGPDARARIDIIDITNTSTGLIKRNPYSIKADLNGMTGALNASVIENKLGAKALVVKILDKDAPVINITSPENGLITNAHALDISGSVLDNGSGIALIEAKVGSGAWKNVPNWTGGIYLMEDYGLDLDGDEMIASVRVTDKAGLTSEANITISVDWTLPDIMVAEPAGLYVKTGKFNLSGTTEPNATLKIDNEVVTVGADGKFIKGFDKVDGTYNITLEAVDRAGNSATAHKLIVVDTVAPVITTGIADKTYVAFPGFRLQGTLTDANGPLELKVNNKTATVDQANHTWSVDLTLTEGANNVTMEAKDPALNTATKTMVVNLDSVAPVIEVTSPKGPYPVYSNKLGQTITGKVVDMNLKTFTVNGKNVSVGANGTFTVDVSLVEGPNHVNLSASDMVADSFFDVFIEICTVPPTVGITSPVNGLVTKNADITIEAKVTGKDPAPNVTYTKIRMRNDQPTVYTSAATLAVGQNVLTVNATDRYGNSATASVTVTYDNVCDFARTKPAKASSTSNKDSVTITGTSEPGATVYINDAAIPVNADGSWTYKLILKEGKNTVSMKAVDAAGNEKTDSFSVTYNDARQFEMGALLGLGIVLMIIGLIIGVVVGRVMSKPRAPPPADDDYPRAPAKTKPAPKDEPAEEEKPFTPEEEPEEEPAPVEKGSLKDKQKDAEVKPTESEAKPEPKAAKPEPKAEPKSASKPEPKKGDDSLEDLLKGLEKKKK